MAGIRTATFLFTDLVNSTATAASISPEAGDTLRQVHFALLRAPLEASGGTEVKNLGDGLMAVYSSASRALDGAVAIQQAVELHNRTAEISLAIRIGIAVGEATHEEGDYFGDPVIEAARLCAAARGGQILTTATLKVVVGRHTGHVLRDIGDLSLKGLPDAIGAVEVLWEPAVAHDHFPLPFRLRPSGMDATFGFSGRASILEAISHEMKEGFAEAAWRLVLLGGEPGIGKTALAAHAARQAHEAGVAVTFGACQEGLGLAFHPWIAAVEHLLEHCRADWSVVLRPGHMAALRRLLPHVTHLLPDGQDLVVDPDAERYLLFDAMARVLGATPSAGIMVVLDDLQWADNSSLQTLAYLLRSTADARGLMVGTYRPGELGPDHPFSGLLADWHREPRVRRIQLSGLADDDVVTLIETAAGQRLGETAVRMAHELRRETAGNPFFLVEMLRHLTEADLIVQEADGSYALRAAPSQLALPSSVTEVISRRVARLGDSAARILSLAAVVGHEFDLPILAEVADTPEDEVLGLLEAAARAALVHEMETPPDRYRFAHALVQSSLYAGLSPARRQRAHQRVADVLESWPGVQPAAVARHLLASMRPGEVGRTVTYARAAGDRALEDLAPDDAASWYTRALEVLADEGAVNRRTRVELLVARAKCEVFSSGSRFKATLREAEALMRDPEDDDLLISAALVRVPGATGSVEDPDPGQVRLIERALLRVKPGDSVERASLLTALANELGLGAGAPAASTAIEAWEMARRLGDPETTIAAYQVVSVLDSGPDSRQRAQVRNDEVLPLLEGWPDIPTRLILYDCAIQMNWVATLDWPKIEAAVDTMKQLGESLGPDVYRWDYQNLRAWMALTRCELKEAEILVHDAYETGKRAGLGAAEAAFGAHTLMLAIAKGQVHLLIEQRAAAGSPLSAIALEWQVTSAWAACLAGRLDLARQEVDAVDIALADIPRNSLWLQNVAELGDTAVYIDRREMAAGCYELLLPYKTSFPFSGSHDIGYAARYLGRMALYLGRVDEAEEHLRFSLRMHSEKKLPYWEARSALDLAEVVRQTNPGEAVQLVSRARAISDQFGLGGLPFPRDEPSVTPRL